MKRILLASVAALGLAGTASAADLAVRAAPVPVPLFTWTGCYLGINGGWVGSDHSYTTDFPWLPPAISQVGSEPSDNALLTRSYSKDQSSGTIGGQFGCQYQTGWLVVGGEWDANWVGLKDDNYSQYPAILNPATGNTWAPHAELTHTQLDWLTTARVRLGAAWWDRVLVYATGGIAMGAVDSYTQVGFNLGTNPNFIPQFFGGYRETKIGWTVGGGLEWAFAANWTAKAEFLYVDLGSSDYVSPSAGGFGVPAFGPTNQIAWHTSVDTKEYVARVGINYLFHLGPAVAPVVARY